MSALTVGKRFRSIRRSLGYSLRYVSSLTSAISQREQDPDFYISAITLSRIERGWQPRRTRLITLAEIYSWPLERILALYRQP